MSTRRDSTSGKMEEMELKQEMEIEDDCFLDEGSAQSSPTPGRVRSHSRSLRAMANPSAVWAHFDLCANDPLRAQCRICGAVVVRGGANPRQCGTTNLHRHLRVHHGGRLIGKIYHVLPTQSKDGSMKTIKVAAQSFVRQMRQVAPQGSQMSHQRQPKTLVLKTIPLKVKQVSPTTIRMPPRQPPQSSQTSQVTSPNTTPQQPTEVCLRWNSYHSNMQNSFPSLLDSEEFVDVTLACEGRSLKCHKMILSSCSDYLAALLRENPCQHPIILMKDLKFWEVEALVKFMYRGEVNVSHDKLPQLLNAAEALQVKGLAGPSPSSQPRTPILQPLSSRSTDQVQTKDNVIKASTSSSSVPSSPKRAHKRQNSESDIGVFTKIRLLNPRSPSSPNPTVKSEPLDIPLSPTEIFPDDDNDRDDGSNPASNFDMVHDDDDPGGDEGEAFCGPADLNDSEDQMEFVPTDFLDQEQDIVEEQDTNCSLDDDNKDEKNETKEERAERDKRERKDEREKDTKSGVKEKSHTRKDKRLT